SRAAVSERERLLRVVAIVSGAILLILAIFIWIAFRAEEPPPKKVAPAVFPNKWFVSSANPGQSHTVKSLRQALEIARSGDQIVIKDDQIEEQVELRDKHDLSIEPEVGKKVIWRCPKKSDGNGLIYIHDAEGSRIRDFFLDGDGRVDHIIYL